MEMHVLMKVVSSVAHPLLDSLLLLLLLLLLRVAYRLLRHVARCLQTPVQRSHFSYDTKQP